MEFGLGWGNLKMGMGSGGANRSPLYLLRQNLTSPSGVDCDLMGIHAAAFLPPDKSGSGGHPLDI